jgi:hypothetical protein
MDEGISPEKFYNDTYGGNKWVINQN